MSQRDCVRCREAFTLLELLVTLAIITVLMAIVLPALSGVRRAAKISKTRVQISQLATALQAYNSEYTQWPSRTTNCALFAAILTGDFGVDGSITNNPRGIVFMDFKSSETNATGVLDPWGQLYRFAFDTNYDRTVDFSGSLPAGVPARATFLIWSTGDPKRPAVIGNWQ